MIFATFNEQGDCLTTSATGPGVEVDELGARPCDLWRDDAGEVVRRIPADLALPAEVDIAEAIEIPAQADTRLIINGQPAEFGSIVLATPGAHFISLAGRHAGEWVVRVIDYAARRQAEYPTIADQLDAIWKGGAELERMRDTIMAVKEANPKPPG